jgi:hypothetical protein
MARADELAGRNTAAAAACCTATRAAGTCATESSNSVGSSPFSFTIFLRMANMVRASPTCTAPLVTRRTLLAVRCSKMRRLIP